MLQEAALVAFLSEVCMGISQTGVLQLIYSVALHCINAIIHTTGVPLYFV